MAVGAPTRAARQQRQINGRWEATGRGLKAMAVAMVIGIVASALLALSPASVLRQRPMAMAAVGMIVAMVAGIIFLAGYFGLFKVPERRAYGLLKASLWGFLLAFGVGVAAAVTGSSMLRLIDGGVTLAAWVLFWLMMVRIGRKVKSPATANLSIVALVLGCISSVIAVYLAVRVWMADSLLELLAAAGELETLIPVAHWADAAYGVLAAVALFVGASAARGMNQQQFRARPVMADPDADDGLADSHPEPAPRLPQEPRVTRRPSPVATRGQLPPRRRLPR